MRFFQNQMQFRVTATSFGNGIIINLNQLKRLTGTDAGAFATPST
jgi:hypothetical protein